MDISARQSEIRAETVVSSGGEEGRGEERSGKEMRREEDNGFTHLISYRDAGREG